MAQTNNKNEEWYSNNMVGHSLEDVDLTQTGR